jgi:hypothetical protein
MALGVAWPVDGWWSRRTLTTSALAAVGVDDEMLWMAWGHLIGTGTGFEEVLANKPIAMIGNKLNTNTFGPTIFFFFHEDCVLPGSIDYRCEDMKKVGEMSDDNGAIR